MDLHIFFVIGGRFMFDREGFIDYVGAKSGNSYASGLARIENLADPENLEIQHNIILALRAHNLMFRDQDYVVSDDQVLIVDEFTGRILPGRRYSDGLHQAIEELKDTMAQAAVWYETNIIEPTKY